MFSIKNITSAFVQFMCLVFAMSFLQAPEARAQTWVPPEGVLGWCVVLTHYPDPVQPEVCVSNPITACEMQRAYGEGGLFYAAVPLSWDYWRCYWEENMHVAIPTKTDFRCVPGYKRVFPGRCIKEDHKNNVCLATSHPIQILTGTKTFRRVDYDGEFDGLGIEAFFSSAPYGGSEDRVFAVPNSLANWSNSFDYEIQLTGYPYVFSVLAPDGSAYRFEKKSDGSVGPYTNFSQPIADTGAKLEFLGTWPTDVATIRDGVSSWRFTDAQNNIVTFQTRFDSTSSNYRIGRPTSVQKADGTALTFAYDANGTLTTITNQAGKALTLTWNMQALNATTPKSGTIAEILFPTGQKIKYYYQDNEGNSATTLATRLKKVEYLDATSVIVDSVTYEYGNASFPTYVTQIKDHANALRWKVTYDALGRATRSEGPNGEMADQIAYSNPGTTFTRTQTDSLGRQTVYTFNQPYDANFGATLTSANGLATVNCPASSTANTYDSNSFLASTTDEEGRITKYTRNAAGQPTQTIEAFGTPQARTTGITWHSTLSLPTQVVGAGLTTNYTYNATGQVTSESLVDTTSHTVPYSTNGQTRTTAYTYGTTGVSKGKLISIDGPLAGTGDTIAFTYNTSGYLATITDAVGKTTTVTAWDWRGAPLTVVDPNSVSTTFTYDIHGRVLTSTANPGANQSQYTYTYDAVGNLTRMTLPKGGYLDYTYDAASRLTLIKNEKNERIELTPNNAGQTTLQVIKSAAGTIVAQQSMVYDEMGRLLQTLGAASTVSTRLAYDKVSNLKQVTDGRDKVWQTGFDPLNRVIEQANPEAEKVRYAYAANDNLTSHKDGRNLETTRTLNGFGEVIREVSPDSGTKIYWYDNAGRLTKTQDADGVETNYAYDNAGRLLTRTFTGAAWETQTFTYDATTSGNKGIGRLTGVTEQSGSTAFIYDAQGRITTDAKTINGIAYSVQYGYDTNGAITQMTLPSGRVVTLTRDNSGLVTAVTTKPASSGTVSNIATSVTYQPFSGLKSLTYGNGLTLADTYNLNGWVTRIQVNDGATSKFDLSYDYYDSGQLGEIVDNAATGRTVYMALSDSGRLTWAGGPWGQEAYDYDAAGNRTGSYLTVGGNTTSRNEITEGDSNRLTQVQDESGVVKRALSYRDGGDLWQDAITGGDTYSYHYSSRKRLVAVKKNNADVANYGYDFREQRVWRRLISGSTSSEIHYIFDQSGHLLAEHNGYTGAVLREYIWLDDKPLAVIDSTGSTKVTYYIHSGHLNEPQMMTNAAKAKVWDAYVTPFGAAQVFTAGTANVDIRLPGQWFQAEAAGSGLNQNYFRDYDPSLGRYIQVDPLGIDEAQNPYAYVDGMPYDYFDFFGLKPGDNYRTMDEAGIQAVRDINDRSILENKEYSGAVYKKKNGQFSYTYPQVGKFNSSKTGIVCPAGTKGVAEYHTHGKKTPGYLNNQFSIGDSQIADNRGTPEYLGTPNGSIQKYLPQPPGGNPIKNIIKGTVVLVPPRK